MFNCFRFDDFHVTDILIAENFDEYILMLYALLSISYSNSNMKLSLHDIEVEIIFTK